MAYINFQPSDFFNTVLTTGAGAGSYTGVGFQPDFLWFKRRDSSGPHFLIDSTRGSSKYLASESTASETTDATFLTSIDSDGWTGGSGFYGSPATLATWNWKADGGTTSSNSDGSITSTVQANTTAGFSIVTWTGTGANATVGHGLGVAPSMIISKNRDLGTGDWVVYHSGIGATKYLQLNQNSTPGTSAIAWNNTEPTSSVFSVGTWDSGNGSGNNIVSYCFADVKGYSKFGSYTGNGSADGPFVYTGFRPAWIMFKGTSSLGGDQAYSTWSIWDINRSTYNVTSLSQELTANTTNAEGIRGSGSSGSGINSFDILSNGFKIRNGSYEYNQGNYIYMAFAEFPLVGSNGLAGTAR